MLRVCNSENNNTGAGAEKAEEEEADSHNAFEWKILDKVKHTKKSKIRCGMADELNERLPHSLSPG